MAKYDPDRPANDVAGEDEFCTYCGADIAPGEPVVRAPLVLTGHVRAHCRHPYACA